MRERGLVSSEETRCRVRGARALSESSNTGVVSGRASLVISLARAAGVSGMHCSGSAHPAEGDRSACQQSLWSLHWCPGSHLPPAESVSNPVLGWVRQ
jgi:hypothetical protein